MDAERTLATDLVQSAPAQMWIGDESLDTGQSFEKVQEEAAIQLVDERARRWSEMLDVLADPLAIVVLVAHAPLVAIHGIELDQHLLQQLRLEQIIEDDVRE